MADTNASPTLPDFRPRRSHKKSRNGCAQCKRRRIKCDELKPRCTRCERGDLSCDYPPDRSARSSPDRTAPETLSLFDGLGSALQGLSIPSPSHSRAASLEFRLGCRVAVSRFPSLRPRPASMWFNQDQYSNHLLDAEDLELFSHYLLHTSRTLTFDGEDSFAVRVGIPNLAFNCPPLMSSVLALAATCRSSDIIAQPALQPGDRERVMELLTIAHRHHMKSLQEIQLTITNPRYFDQVLANAALMALYGVSSHRVRIWIASTAPVDEILADDFLPKHSEWMSLFRAAHIAYFSLLQNLPENIAFSAETPESTSIPSISVSDIDASLAGEDEMNSSMEQSASSITWSTHVLYPAMAATASQALENLQGTAQSLAIVCASITADGEPMGEDSISAQKIQASLIALNMLSNIASEIFPIQTPGFVHPETAQHGAEPLDQLAEVSDWLRDYLTLAIATKTSRSLRRVVLAFVNKVPQEFAAVVQNTLDSIPLGTGDESSGQLDNSSTQSFDMDATDQLIMDIFAHWLVFMMLLDVEWLIGDIGLWELGRIVTLIQHRVPVMNHYRDFGDDWWPASMYKVAMELRKHMNRRP